VFSVIVFISSIVHFSLGLIVFQAGLAGYSSHPLFPLYALFGAFLHLGMAINLFTSNFFFLYRIYSARGFSLKEFLIDLALHQDGFRIFFLSALNIFVGYCIISILIYGQTYATGVIYRKNS
jgi:hypothetical protein